MVVEAPAVELFAAVVAPAAFVVALVVSDFVVAAPVVDLTVASGAFVAAVVGFDVATVATGSFVAAVVAAVVTAVVGFTAVSGAAVGIVTMFAASSAADIDVPVRSLNICMTSVILALTFATIVLILVFWVFMVAFSAVVQDIFEITVTLMIFACTAIVLLLPNISTSTWLLYRVNATTAFVRDSQSPKLLLFLPSLVALVTALVTLVPTFSSLSFDLYKA